MKKKKILILGAAGRDFHNFNTVFRSKKDVKVVAFTATQITGIAGRTYPASLAGPLYPDGIPIIDENEMESFIAKNKIDEVVFSYSDVTNDKIMQVAARAGASGATFTLLPPQMTYLTASVPVIAVCAVRTGCGKSQTTRFVIDYLRSKGKKVVAIRHPMPYGNLEKQKIQRFEKLEDLDRYECTIEEREEYKPHIERGNVIYAGVDYQAILEEAQKEAEIIIWDGGNNDTSFIKPDMLIVVTDPFRPDAPITHYHGMLNFILADVILINKVDTAKTDDVNKLKNLAKKMNPAAKVIEAESPITVTTDFPLKGKKVAVVEDGPTLTHGDMTFGAGTVAAKNAGVSEIIDPRPYAKGLIKSAFEKYPHLGSVVPALGYLEQQMKDLEATLNAIPCDAIVSATPADLTLLLKLQKPVINIKYELSDTRTPSLRSCIDTFLEKISTR